MRRIHHNLGQKTQKLGKALQAAQSIANRGRRKPEEASENPEDEAPKPPSSIGETQGSVAEQQEAVVSTPPSNPSQESQVTAPAVSEPLLSNHWIEVLSTRTLNCLENAGISTLEELQKKSSEELLAISGFGSTCLEEVERFLRMQDLSPPTVALPADDPKPSRDSEDPGEVPPPMTAPLSSNPYFGLLSTRTYNCLSNAGISSMAELCECDREELLRLWGFGEKCLREVNAFLEANHLLSIPESISGATGYTMLSAEAQTWLQEANIGTREDFQSKDLREMVKFPGFDTKILDEIVFRWGFPSTQNEQDFLLLLSISKVARDRIGDYADPGFDNFIESVTHSREGVEHQVNLGILHESVDGLGTNQGFDPKPLASSTHACGFSLSGAIFALSKSRHFRG